MVSFVDPILDAGASYRVAALNTVGDVTVYALGGFPNVTVKSQYATVTDVSSAPADPTNLTASLQSGPQIDLNWTDNSNNETSFVIERATNADPFSQLASVGIDSTNFVDNTVIPGNSYTYQVKASNAAGDLLYAISNTVDVPALPGDPTNLNATLITSTQVDLAWTDTASNEDGFVVERSDDGGTTWNQVGQTGIDVAVFSDVSVIPGMAYQYRVFAFNISGDSQYSNILDVATPQVVPAAPTNLAATAIASTQVDLTWSDNANNESGFRVERSDDFRINLEFDSRARRR